MADRQIQSQEALWYKDAIIYEVHIKSFYDSNGDGIGDFGGLIQKLDYLHDLGVTALWLLPFYPSPLLDDGYDIADYFRINPDYGTLGDFRRLLREAHKREIRVITELVINHTSDQHRWFQRSRRAKPGSIWRDFYVWSDTTERYRDARIIFTDFESSNWAWDHTAQAYYWHRFYNHQPDLNYDNPRVRKEILRVLDYWFNMGVDGMRLDAVPYLFEREGTNCENLPETHTFLKELRAHVDAKFKDRMLLAEANQWPEDAEAYFGEGDECHMAFHFPIMPRLFMAVRMEDRFPVIDILEQSLGIPADCQWGMFLRNHDELTLEMVTDEERDYMYKAYAQDPRARINVGIRRRLAPLLDNSRRRIELMNSLLLSLPGTPILYYGDEIGMGDNYYLGDRDGVRTPMQWSPDRNAGFSVANPHKLFLPVIIDAEYHYNTVNVESQSRNLSSLLWFMRRILGIRKRFQAFGRGQMEFLRSDNGRVLTFLRTYEDETILVVANLSRHCQAVRIQMPEYAGYSVHEIFSDNEFPEVEKTPYVLTLTPHSFYWFTLEKPVVPSLMAPQESPEVQSGAGWDRILSSSAEPQIVRALREYIRRARWFGGKGRKIREIRIADSLTIPVEPRSIYVLLVEINYANAPTEQYVLPVGFATGDLQIEIIEEFPNHVIARARVKDEEGILYEGIADDAFRQALLETIARGRSKKLGRGTLVGRRGARFGALLGDRPSSLASRVLKAEQSNTSIVYDDTFFLKLYRRVEEGVNPDVELSRLLTEQTAFQNLPGFAGAIEWRRRDAGPMTMAMLLEMVPNEGDAWTYTLNNVDRSFAHALTLAEKLETLPEIPPSVLDVEPDAIPELVLDFIGSVYLEMISILGQRTGELHQAMLSLSQNSDVAPEPFSLLYQKSLYQSVRGLIVRVFRELESAIPSLDEDIARHVTEILGRRRHILNLARRLTERKIPAMKIRTHGDFHLGQVLYTGKDFLIIDFEGEPARSITERRLKQPALRDIAGMIRSFHYAAHGSSLLRAVERGADRETLRHWADLWYSYVSGTFLRSYLRSVEGSQVVPQDPNDFAMLLETFLVEKAVYELGYELNNRPDWLMIPVHGIEEILK